MRKLLLILFLFISCESESQRVRFLKGNNDKWWLAGGIAASTNYTIYDPLTASTQALSYVNLANPGTRDAIAGVVPTWAQFSGWTFNGTTQYLNTQTKFLANSTVIIWVENWTGVYALASVKALIRPILSGNTRLTIGTNTDIVSDTYGGILSIRAGENAYKNGYQGPVMASFPAGTDYDLYVGARNSGSGPDGFGGGQIYRIAIYDIKLTDAQVEAVIVAMKDVHSNGADPYQSTVMSLNPICYYPMTQKYGSALWDVSGHNAHGQIKYQPVGQPGLKGLSMAGTGNSLHFCETYGGWAANTGINLDEFSAACWIKVTADVSNQIRVFNFWANNTTEYAAIEIRVGVIAGLFFKEQGYTDASHSNVMSVTNGAWTHMVLYNSKSTGRYGMYVNGTKYDFARPVGLLGFTDNGSVGFPQFLHDGLFNAQHWAVFDHALTQSEVNIIYVP